MQEVISKDIHSLKNFLGTNFKSAHIFGSYVNNDTNEVNDIDIAIRTQKPVEKAQLQEFIKENMALNCQNISLNEYGPSAKAPKSLTYDLVFIDDDHQDGYFMAVNEGKMKRVL